MGTMTIFVSQGVGKPPKIQATPMNWSRVSTELLRDLVLMDPPSMFYSKAQMAAARRELKRRD